MKVVKVKVLKTKELDNDRSLPACNECGVNVANIRLRTSERLLGGDYCQRCLELFIKVERQIAAETVSNDYSGVL